MERKREGDDGWKGRSEGWGEAHRLDLSIVIESTQPAIREATGVTSRSIFGVRREDESYVCWLFSEA